MQQNIDYQRFALHDILIGDTVQPTIPVELHVLYAQNCCFPKELFCTSVIIGSVVSSCRVFVQRQACML